VVGFDTTITYEKLKDACDLVRLGLPYLATHPDINCPTEDGFIPDVGAVLAFVEASTGRKPDHIIGKPHQPMVDTMLRWLALPADRVCMVGDRLYTDIALGKYGLRTILVLSGEADPEDLKQTPFVPDLILDDIQALLTMLQSEKGPDGH
jgi:4-nitrophenyl phosphatase/NagD protein